MKKRQTTAFYMETLVLIAILIVVILILTWVFGMGKSRSQEARLLTGAVSLAQDAAEAVSAARSPQGAAELLSENGNAAYAQDTGITARYDRELQPDPEGPFYVMVGWDPEELVSGTLVSSHITVLYDTQPEPVYTLDTAVYIRNEE